MVNRFNGLRHDAVVGRHDENHDVGYSRTTRPHRRKGRVPRGVEERHAATVFHADHVRPDVLGNASRLAYRPPCFAQVVEQRGFAVIDVAHDGDDRRPRLGFADFFLLDDLIQLGLFGLQRDHFAAQLVGQRLHGVHIEALIDGRHGTHLQTQGDYFADLDAELFGKFAERDKLAYFDLAELAIFPGTVFARATLVAAAHPPSLS